MLFDEDQGADVFAGTDNATTFHSQDAPNTKREMRRQYQAQTTR
jgi:hypothetical protein